MSVCNNVTVYGLPYGSTYEQKTLAMVPEELLQGLPHQIKGRVKFGLNERTVDIVPDTIPDVIRLSRKLMDELNIYKGMKVSVNLKDGLLSLGPVVGYLTNWFSQRSILDSNFAPKTVQTIEAAKKAGVLLYYFRLGDILWTERSVKAAVYIPGTGSWEYKKMPLPDVIYDRGRAEELSIRKMKEGLDVRERLFSLEGLHRINARHYFDKWDLHCRLSRHDDMKKYMPDTVLSKGNTEELESMIEKYSTVYIKACLGNNGRSVIRVRKDSGSSYLYDHFRSKLVKKSTGDLSNILKASKKFMENREFIIQQGIDTLIHDGNKVDVRVLVQKDDSGKWCITNMPVRIAVADSPVTSTKSGSDVYKFDDAFLNILKVDAEKTETIKKNIYRLINTAVSTIEKEYGPFGEMGIDVAIDKNYNLWFLESNAKPAKDTIIKSGSKEDIENAYIPPFKYSRYLSGFGLPDSPSGYTPCDKPSMPPEV